MSLEKIKHHFIIGLLSRISIISISTLITSAPIFAQLIPDTDHDCLYLEKNKVLHYKDSPMSSELKRTAWAYSKEYANRFLMPENNIEPLVGAEHSRYVVRQDVNLICEVGGECWPMNHCQFELYVPQTTQLFNNRSALSYQDPMWGDKIARYLSPVRANDAKHMNDRRLTMRYSRMDYEEKRDGQWKRVGEMQLIGYRKDISKELDVVVLEGDCRWYQQLDDQVQSARIVLGEGRGEENWRHEVVFPRSYLTRVVDESTKRLWPSVDGYSWWWADTWWPEAGFEIGYAQRFTEDGAKSQGSKFWLWDMHVWDYTPEFAERFGMPMDEEHLTTKKEGLQGAYAMSGIKGCGVSQSMERTGPYNTHHGYNEKYLQIRPPYQELYCMNSLGYAYEFYLPFDELKAMGIEQMNLATQKTWMPKDIYRGWHDSEDIVNLCRHPDHREWFFGIKLLSASKFQQIKHKLKKKTIQHVKGNNTGLSIDINIFPGVAEYMASKSILNFATVGVERYFFLTIDELPSMNNIIARKEAWRKNSSTIETKFSKLYGSKDIENFGFNSEYLIFKINQNFIDKIHENEEKWNSLWTRLEIISNR